MTPAEKQSQYRRRQRKGLMVVRVEIKHVSVAEALIAAGLLDPRDYDDAGAIGRALGRAEITIKKCYRVTPEDF